MKKNKKILILNLLALLLLTSCDFKKEATLTKLNKAETEAVSFFFSWLIEEPTVAYVLFGNKPVFVGGFYSLESDFSKVSNLDVGMNQKISEGARVLKKFKLDNKKFHLSFTNDPNLPGYTEIKLINKIALSKTIKNNLKLFQTEIGNDYTEQDLIEQILEKSFKEFFKGKVSLQGIVLGYGTQNAIAYERVNQLLQEIGRQELLVTFNNNAQSIQSQKEIAITYAKKNPERWGDCIDYLNQFTYFSDDKVEKGLNVKIPFSYLEGTTESKKLISEYTKNEKKLAVLRKDPHFLNKVLKKLE